MLRRFRLPGCLLVATSLATPGVYAAGPSPEEGTEDTTGLSAEPEPEPEDPPTAVSEEASDDEAPDDAYDEVEEEDEDDAATASQLPERMPRLQRFGWYHVLGTFALGTTAGLLAGLAERDEDRAFRLASGYDLENGRATLYSDRQEEYERILDRGQAFQTSAIVIGAAAAATAVAAITLFAIDARRRPRGSTARRTRIGAGSVEVRF